MTVCLHKRAPLGYLSSGQPFYPISGAQPRGYNAAGDILTQTADGIDLNKLWAEIQKSMEVANTKRTAFDNVFTHAISVPAEGVLQSVGGADFERATEYGLPVGARVAPAKTLFGAGFDWFDLANNFTWQFLADAPANQVQAVNNQAIDADSRLTHNAVLNRVMNGAQGVNENGTPIYGLYNADGMVPPDFNGTVFDGAHTHYLTSGAADFDGNDLATLVEHIEHHGYGHVADGARVVVFVSTAQAKVIRGFRVGVTSPYDFIPGTSSPAYLTTETIVGGTAPAQYNGLPLIGSFGNAWVCEDSLTPAGYVLAVATGGSGSSVNVVSFREHSNSGLRGLRLVKGRTPDYPLIDSVFNHGFGVGVRHRGAAAVMKVTAGAYTAPVIV